MYRFFVARGNSLRNTSCMPRQNIMQHSGRLCLFCNFYHRKVAKSVMYHQTRGNATTINLLGLHASVKKKLKPRLKKYAELLEVTEKTTNNRKAAVQKLNAADLSILVDQPDITIDKLHKLRDPVLKKSLHSKFQSRDTALTNENEFYHNENIEMISHNRLLECWNKSIDNKNEVFEDLGEITQSELDLPDHSHVPNENENILEYENKSDYLSKLELVKERLKGRKSSDLEVNSNGALTKNQRKISSDEYITDLIAYMRVYVNNGMVNRAHKTLLLYRKYMHNKLPLCKKCVELYNVLLNGYASKGEVQQVLELFNKIKLDSVTPNSYSYAAVFDAFGRQKQLDDSQMVLLQQLHKEMIDKYNITLNDIFNETPFRKDQRQNILKAVKLVVPDFEPTYDVPNVKYSCALVDKVPMVDKYQSPAEGLFTLEELQESLKLQVKMECQNEVQVKSIEKLKGNLEVVLSNRQKIAELEKHWKEVANAAFERNLSYLKGKEYHSHNALMILHPFLEALDQEHYINAIVREIRQIAQGSEVYSTCLSFLYSELGRYIYKKYEIQINRQSGVLDKTVQIYTKYLNWYLNPKNTKRFKNMNNRSVWQLLVYEEEKNGTSLKTMDMNWPKDVISNIGRFLYKIILNDIILKPGILKGHDLQHSIPAFFTLFRSNGKFLVEQIKPHPFISKLYRDSQQETLMFETILLPSTVPPCPWSSIHRGGYLISKSDFMRIPNNSPDPWRKLENTPLTQLYPVLDALNQLGSIPWTVNSPVLDLIIKIFQNGGSEKLNVPQSPSALSPLPPLDKNATQSKKIEMAKAIARYRRKKGEMYSLWCDALYRLSLANHFRNSTFWLPHNLDFRGRVYPIPPHLNHLASDLSRSLLLFARGKPLGPNGLDWLKIHVINLTGLKKGKPLIERLQFANENLDNILDSAEKPLNGKMWWSKSDEPWQTLAACKEIAQALKSANVEEYESRFPVHQDGSCNGLQHYAALGRDTIGAISVNLTPSSTPQDVYVTITNKVEEMRKVDAANGVEIAKKLEGFIKRKVIKQTIMTTVYGVTKFGARLQIMKQLKDTENFPEQYVWLGSLYLTDKTFQSLRTMFKSAREIQDWFTTCARIISQTYGKNVEWITPLGLPIVQPYMKLQKFVPGKPFSRKKNSIDSLKQKNAFPPNFIHSLDSTHMMLTSINCDKAGLTFISVHDCFWTHACTVNTMNKICREQFVAIHSEPILKSLSKFLVEYYTSNNDFRSELQENINKKSACCFSRVPKKGDFDINEVLSSVYFFS